MWSKKMPKESGWYWYWRPGEKDPWPEEVYEGCWRKHSDGYWWSESIQMPTEKPPMKEKRVKRITQKPSKKATQKPKKKQETMPEMPVLPENFRGKGLL